MSVSTRNERKYEAAYELLTLNDAEYLMRIIDNGDCIQIVRCHQRQRLPHRQSAPLYMADQT